MPAEFVHLRLYSEYSICKGIVRVKPLMQVLRDRHMPAVALTDFVNLFGMVKFYKAALSAGIKPIIGCEVLITNPDDEQQPFSLILLCQNQQGYLNLSKLISKAYIEGQQHDVPLIDKNWIESEGLIALSGGLQGDIGQALLKNQPDLAKANLQFWQNLFPQRFYLELQRSNRPYEAEYNDLALALAEQFNLPVVATNAVCFLNAEDFEAHEARVCIYQGTTLDDANRRSPYTSQHYLRSAEEMAELFADLPQALQNSVEIAKRCNLQLNLGQSYLPDFPVPQGMSTADFLQQQAKLGLETRLTQLFSAQDIPQKRAAYDERLLIELNVINNMGFPGYFLIVADFIQWSKQNHIPVGPGRGSGAGSLVAYALGITDLDPLQYDLLFERFLNPERVSMPDFDIDFCMDGRDRVIDYVANRYGRESVSQIITYGSMAAKAVVRDVGRVLGHPYGFVDKIAKLIPFELGITLDNALAQEELLRERYQNEEEVRILLDLAKKLEGITRNAGKHAGGVVIAPSKLTDFAPLYCEAGGKNLVTQFDKDDVEAVGLVKFDFLGLRTLTIIDWALQTINQNSPEKIDINLIPTNDAKTFELLKRCETTAIFQLESRGMKDLIRRLQPDCFEEIIALVALFRPGPLQSGMVDDFIDRKHGRAQVEYLHPDLTTVLKPTYGIILYQEQVMQIAQVLAGYSLGEADLLRRAMGKKKPEEMAKQREIFLKGAAKNKVENKTAAHIFDLMEKFAGYGFNKSHSAAYALLSYQTAWLKTHYPGAFMAAVLSSDMDNTDKVVGLIDECKQMRLKIIFPDLNQSFYKFTALDDHTILYGLGAIKGVGQAAIENIVNERQSKPYHSLFDFCQRQDLKKINRRVLEALIRSGAMDGFNSSRANLFHSIDKAITYAEQQAKNVSSGQSDLFSMGQKTQSMEVDYVASKDWDEHTLLQGEKETLGLYLSGHPLDFYRREIDQFTTTNLARLNPTSNQSIVIAGLVVAIRTMMTKKQERMAFVTLDDGSGRVEIAIFADLYQEYRPLIIKDHILIVEGNVSVDNYSGGYRMSAKKLYNIDRARSHFARYLEIGLNHARIDASKISLLKQLLKSFQRGTTPVAIHYQRDCIAAKVLLGQQWYIKPADELIRNLSACLESAEVNFIY